MFASSALVAALIVRGRRSRQLGRRRRQALRRSGVPRTTARGGALRPVGRGGAGHRRVAVAVDRLPWLPVGVGGRVLRIAGFSSTCPWWSLVRDRRAGVSPSSRPAGGAMRRPSCPHALSDRGPRRLGAPLSRRRAAHGVRSIGGRAGRSAVASRGAAALSIAVMAAAAGCSPATTMTDAGAARAALGHQPPATSQPTKGVADGCRVPGRDRGGRGGRGRAVAPGANGGDRVTVVAYRGRRLEPLVYEGRAPAGRRDRPRRAARRDLGVAVGDEIPLDDRTPRSTPAGHGGRLRGGRADAHRPAPRDGRPS